jgi:hypothetical protein
VLLTVIAQLIGPLTLILAGVFAVVALVLIVGEKPSKPAPKS